MIHFLRKYWLILLFVLSVVSVGAQLSTVRVGVMLPLKNGDAVSPRAVDFYRGLVLAVDSLRKSGTNFRIYTYNTHEQSVASILRDTIIPHLHVVFGPDDPIVLKAISDYVTPYGVKVVNAFCPASEAIKGNPNFYSLYSTPQQLAQNAIPLFIATFGKKVNFVVVDTKKVAHPLVAEFKNALKKVRFLQLGFSQTELESRLQSKSTNILLLSSADKESAQEILTQIALFCQTHSQYDVRVIGYPEWENYLPTLRKLYQQCNTYVYSQYYNNTLSLRNQNFISLYRQLFRQPMNEERPVMAMFGFDAGYFMLKAIQRYGSKYQGENVYAAPLQNAFQLQQVGNSGGFANQRVLLVHYKNDGHLELIENKSNAN